MDKSPREEQHLILLSCFSLPNLERIADHSCRLADIGYEAGRASTSHVVEFAEKALEILDTAMSSFLNKKSDKSTITIDNGKSTLSKARKYFEDKYKKDVENPREFENMNACVKAACEGEDISKQIKLRVKY